MSLLISPIVSPQLVGTSTSDDDRGLIPIFEQSCYPIKTLQTKCLVVIFTLKDRVEGQPNQAAELRELGIPLVEIELAGVTDFVAEIFKWEIATALACVPLGLNPFREADNQSRLRIPTEPLENIANKRDSLLPVVRIRENGLALYMEGQTRRELSTLGLRDALRTFLELRNSDSYIAIFPFFKPSESDVNTLRTLRDFMSHTLEMPVQVSTGPRYLHALGTMYKDGPANGIFIILTAAPREDLAIPGAGYTFGELQLALALTECETLENYQQHVIRLHCDAGAEKGLLQFSDILKQALVRIRGVEG